MFWSKGDSLENIENPLISEAMVKAIIEQLQAS